MTHLEIMKFRHACKIFDGNKKIGKADFDAILQAGILAPSSTGLEQWDFLVVQKQGAARADPRKIVESAADHLLLTSGCDFSKDQGHKARK